MPAAPADLPALPPFPGDTASKSDLVAGGVHATVTPSQPGSTLSVGSSTFATVEITDTGGAKMIEVRADADGGEIRAIVGKSIKAMSAPGGLVARIPVAKGVQPSAVVELYLKDGSKGPDGKLRNRMRITVSAVGGASDSSVLSWPLANCSGNYYSELQRILGDRRAQLTGTLSELTGTSPALPAKWLFSPGAGSPQIDCRSKKARNKPECATPAATTGAAPAEMSEREVISAASEFLRTKGALAAFGSRHGALHQVSYNMLNGLKIYMEQVPHPALCTGVEDMFAYYVKNTPTLRATIDKAHKTARAAAQIAAQRVADLAHPSASGAASQQASNGTAVVASNVAAPADIEGLTGLVKAVAKAILSPSDASAFDGDNDPRTALDRMRTLLDGGAASSKPDAEKAAAVSALGMIEAAIYLRLADGKYSHLEDGVFGTMSAISDAHKKACVCGG